MGNLVTRFPNGVSNIAEGMILSDLKMLDPTVYHSFFEDFDTYALTDGTNAQWTETLNSGTIAMSATNGGALVVTCANTDEAITQTQRTRATFTMAVGKKFFFKARAKVSSNVLTDFFIGCASIDTTLISASAIDVTDAIGFFKGATDTSFTVYCRKDATTGSTSVASVGAISSDTFFTVGLYYNGVSTLYYSVDDVVHGSLAVSTSYLPDAAITPSICVGQEGTGGANLGTIDYIFVAQER